MNSWQITSDERPPYSTIVGEELSHESLWSLQLFHTRRTAYINTLTYPAAHDLATHADATRYLVEVSALAIDEASVRSLVTKLHELDRTQILFVKDYQRDEAWLLNATALRASIETLPTLTAETLSELKSSFSHPILDAMIRSIHSEPDMRDVFAGFIAEIAEAEEELQSARADIAGVEKRALRVWFRLDA